MALTASTQVEVERSVRDRLYGERSEVSATPMPRPREHRRVGGRYRLLERVGAGGMAAVYRARDERLKRDVAVKVIAEHLVDSSAFVRRFRIEGQLGARLAHPNIVGILDAGIEPRDFLVMEFIDGHDADKLLKRNGRLAPDHAVRLLTQVCDALAYAHARDVLHNDVTPGNILISRHDGTPKLADFGIASGGPDLPAWPAGDVSGTLGYIAPEILRGAEPSPRSDLYSLGVVAYRLLTGRSPIHPREPEAPLAEARPGLPRMLTEAVGQALADEPDARQASVAEFREHLVYDKNPPTLLQTAA